MDKEIVFSVIIPVYNAERFLRQSVESVLNQTYQNYEVILVDDGSTDSSPSICDGIADKYEKVAAYHKDNTGPVETRRYGISKAKGKWIVHLDADDCLRKNTLETLDFRIRKYQQLDCIIIGIERFDDDFSEYYSSAPLSDDVHITDKHEIVRKVLFDASYTSLVRKVVKRELVGIDDLSPYYHIQLGEDMVQTLEILKYCNNYLLIPDPLYMYRINPGSLTRAVDYSLLNISCEKEDMVIDFLSSNHIFTEKDFEEYRDYHSRGTCIKMVEIAAAHTAVHHKIRLYRQCQANHFIKEFVIGGKPSKYKALNMLNDGHFHTLLLYCLWIKAKSIILHQPLFY